VCGLFIVEVSIKILLRLTSVRRSVVVSGFLGTLNQIVVCVVNSSGWMGGECFGQCFYVKFLKNRKDWIMAHPRKLAASQNHHICTKDRNMI
jgi:hypothetical protein